MTGSILKMKSTFVKTQKVNIKIHPLFYYICGLHFFLLYTYFTDLLAIITNNKNCNFKYRKNWLLICFFSYLLLSYLSQIFSRKHFALCLLSNNMCGYLPCSLIYPIDISQENLRVILNILISVKLKPIYYSFSDLLTILLQGIGFSIVNLNGLARVLEIEIFYIILLFT